MSRQPKDFDAAPTTFRGLTLFPFQRSAIAAIFSGKGVVVAAPTGAGKTLVADYAIERALADDRRVVYTSPIKALSNQKFRDFREAYGDDRVGLMTGDVTVKPDSPLLVMTTEIFRNTIFEAPERLGGFDFAIFDEVHYIDDRDRGTVWEESLIYMPKHIRPVGLSATVPNVEELAAWISEVREIEVAVIIEPERPVPLIHKVWIPGRGPRNLDEVKRHYSDMGRVRDRRRRHGGKRPDRRRNRKAQARVMEEASHDMLDYLQEHDRLPAIYFCFSRRECQSLAEAHSPRPLLTTEERDRMLDLFDELSRKYDVSDAERTLALRRLASNGVLYHHAGMLPIDKEIVERLFNTGLVKLLFATETFALGVNMPARSVAFHALTKFNGRTYGPLLGREYWQMAGRAGRQGIDERGWVYALLDDGEMTYDNLVYLHGGATEAVHSRFNLSYSAILSLYRRIGDRVPDAWQRSFARFQRNAERAKAHKGKQGRKRKRSRRHGPGARLIESRLDVLKDENYIAGGELTRKGELCAQINGYEIAVTEAYDGGWLFRCDAVEMAMLFASIVYESRPSDASARAQRRLKGIAVPFSLRMEGIAQHELSLGIRIPTRGPDFGLAGPVERFAEGASFEEALDRTTLAAGDLVRTLRMTIQLLRQTAHALPKGDPCIEVLHEARARIDRDVVDAKRQLELG